MTNLFFILYAVCVVADTPTHHAAMRAAHVAPNCWFSAMA
jgi:hypothetical protein